MAGANYMGGKRNAFKARSKNTALRVQKAFFGRQRLGLDPASENSSAKLVDNYSAGTIDSKLNGRPEISLKHAQRRRDSVASLDSLGFIPGPSPLKPPISQLVGLGSSSDGIRHSEILDRLDKTEPMFIRAKLDRLLQMPDLAGLHRRPAATKAYEITPDRSLKRKRSTELDKNFQPKVHSKRQLLSSPKTAESPQSRYPAQRRALTPEGQRQSHINEEIAMSSPLNSSNYRNTLPKGFPYVTPSGSSLPNSSVPSLHESDFTTTSSPSTLGLRHPESPHISVRQFGFHTAASPPPEPNDIKSGQLFSDEPGLNLVGYSSPDIPIEPPSDVQDPLFFGTSFEDVSPENLLYQDDPWKALDILLDLSPQTLGRRDGYSSASVTISRSAYPSHLKMDKWLSGGVGLSDTGDLEDPWPVHQLTRETKVDFWPGTLQGDLAQETTDSYPTSPLVEYGDSPRDLYLRSRSRSRPPGSPGFAHNADEELPYTSQKHLYLLGSYELGSDSQYPDQTYELPEDVIFHRLSSPSPYLPHPKQNVSNASDEADDQNSPQLQEEANTGPDHLLSWSRPSHTVVKSGSCIAGDSHQDLDCISQVLPDTDHDANFRLDLTKNNLIPPDSPKASIINSRHSPGDDLFTARPTSVSRSPKQNVVLNAGSLSSRCSDIVHPGPITVSLQKEGDFYLGPCLFSDDSEED